MLQYYNRSVLACIIIINLVVIHYHIFPRVKTIMAKVFYHFRGTNFLIVYSKRSTDKCEQSNMTSLSHDMLGPEDHTTTYCLLYIQCF